MTQALYAHMNNKRKKKGYFVPGNITHTFCLLALLCDSVTIFSLCKSFRQIADLYIETLGEKASVGQSALVFYFGFVLLLTFSIHFWLPCHSRGSDSSGGWTGARTVKG
jgi:hypothetical protein